MNASSMDVKDMLEAVSSLGLTFATNLFVAKEPNEPRDTVTIFDTPGARPQLSTGGCKYYYSSIQIRVRNKDYQTGYALAENIQNLLHGQAQETWNGTLYSLITSSNDVYHMDWDENGNARFIINLELQRR